MHVTIAQDAALRREHWVTEVNMALQFAPLPRRFSNAAVISTERFYWGMNWIGHRVCDSEDPKKAELRPIGGVSRSQVEIIGKLSFSIFSKQLSSDTATHHLSQ
jgi:hypothetical protein